MLNKTNGTIRRISSCIRKIQKSRSFSFPPSCSLALRLICLGSFHPAILFNSQLTLPVRCVLPEYPTDQRRTLLRGYSFLRVTIGIALKEHTWVLGTWDECETTWAHGLRLLGTNSVGLSMHRNDWRDCYHGMCVSSRFMTVVSTCETAFDGRSQTQDDSCDENETISKCRFSEQTSSAQETRV
jgi:hypothetical protein